MADQRRTFVVGVHPAAARAACQQVAKDLRWTTERDDTAGLTLRSAGGFMAKDIVMEVDIAEAAEGETGARLDVRGASEGFGPLVGRYINQTLDVLQSRVEAGVRRG